MNKVEFQNERNQEVEVRKRAAIKPAKKDNNQKKNKPAAEHISQLEQKAVDDNLDAEMEVVDNLLSESKLLPHNVADPRHITMLEKLPSPNKFRESRDIFSDTHPSNFLQKFELNEEKIPDIFEHHTRLDLMNKLGNTEDIVDQDHFDNDRDYFQNEEEELSQTAKNLKFVIDNKEEINEDVSNIRDIVDVDQQLEIDNPEVAYSKSQEENIKEDSEGKEANDDDTFKKPRLVKNKRKMEDTVTQIANQENFTMNGKSLVCEDVNAKWVKGKRLKQHEQQSVAMLMHTNDKLTDIFDNSFILDVAQDKVSQTQREMQEEQLNQDSQTNQATMDQILPDTNQIPSQVAVDIDHSYVERYSMEHHDHISQDNLSKAVMSDLGMNESVEDWLNKPSLVSRDTFNAIDINDKSMVADVADTIGQSKVHQPQENVISDQTISAIHNFFNISNDEPKTFTDLLTFKSSKTDRSTAAQLFSDVLVLALNDVLCVNQNLDIDQQLKRVIPSDIHISKGQNYNKSN